MRILIAEDEPMSRDLLVEYLSPYGECVTVENGRQAVQIFKTRLEEKKAFTLVCMDIMMPELNGQGAVKQIRIIEKENGISIKDGVKIIMITALSAQKNVFEAFLMGGVSKYIVKPIKENHLLTEIRNMGLIK